MPDAIEVRKVPLHTVSDASELGKLIDEGVFEASRVIAVIGKTEGNGGVNDYTRIIADRSVGELFFGNYHLMDYELMGGDARDAIEAETKKLVFAVTIHDADARKQSFGQVSNAYIRVLNKADGKEIARYDLSEDASTETAMNFGELYNHNGEWKFKAIGQGYAGGLAALASSYGVNLG